MTNHSMVIIAVHYFVLTTLKSTRDFDTNTTRCNDYTVDFIVPNEWYWTQPMFTLCCECSSFHSPQSLCGRFLAKLLDFDVGNCWLFSLITSFMLELWLITCDQYLTSPSLSHVLYVRLKDANRAIAYYNV